MQFSTHFLGGKASKSPVLKCLWLPICLKGEENGLYSSWAAARIVAWEVGQDYQIPNQATEFLSESQATAPELIWDSIKPKCKGLGLSSTWGPYIFKTL